MRLLLILLFCTVLGCTRDGDADLKRVLSESLGVSISNMYDLEEVERGFLARFPLGTLKQDLLKALSQLDLDSGVYFVDVEDGIVVECDVAESAYVTTAFDFEGQRLCRVYSFGTNLSIKDRPKGNEEPNNPLETTPDGASQF